MKRKHKRIMLGVHKGIKREDEYVDEEVREHLNRSKKITSSLWYPHVSK